MLVQASSKVAIDVSSTSNHGPELDMHVQDIDLVPSHVVPSLTVDAVHNDVYSAYNKPGAVMYWLQVSQ